MDGKQILISGGDGFLGRALSRRLLARGARVDVVDDHSTSIPLGPQPRCRVIEADICTAPLDALEQESGRAPSEKDLAAALGMALADYQKMLQEARGHQLVYLEDLVAEDGEDFLARHFVEERSDPAQLFEDEDARQALVRAIAGLPEREKMMMALYYEQDLNLREIGEVMGVSESRVCQLHSQAVMRLRARLFGGTDRKAAKATGIG